MSRLDELESILDSACPLRRNERGQLLQMIQLMRQMRIACQTVTHQFYHKQCEEVLAAFDKFDMGE